ncbi:MAG: sensor histidine kinase [Elusimicrobiaceae bacterium]|nr:sensor histidine kinase [Elusimicrobiaceae bacterium]
MSLFSKLFKLFLAVVLIPMVPLVLLLAYYQIHLKDNILETHANLAQIVSSSLNQHIEDLSWRLSFAQNISEYLQQKKDPKNLLQEALVANPDFLMLAVLSGEGKELYRVGNPDILRQLPKIDLTADETLPLLAKAKQLSVSSFDVTAGRPISEFIYPLPNGDFLYGILSFFSFLARVQEQSIGSTGHIYIMDQAGQIYTSEYQYKPDFDTAALQKAFSRSNRLITQLKTPQDTYVGAYAPTPILGAYVAVLQLKREAYRSIYYTNIILALFLLTIATLSYFGALTFAERLGEPIEALSHAAQEVSHGNLDNKIDEDIGWGEFKGLIASFNKMTEDLKDYQALQLRTQVSEMKEQVFRAVAHDLRAPLLGLQGYLHILKSGKITEGEKKQYLELMSQAARNLSALLEDVLDVSRVEAGILAPQKQKVDVAEIVRQVVDTLAPVAAEKKIRLENNVSSLVLSADSKLLQRVITNLVSNAIKFTDQGFVRICANEAEKCYFITVADSGIGITEAEKKELFQKYRQLHTDRPGFGLGLFISRQIVEAHGGKLEVDSQAGQGSTFTISLPKEKK